MSHGGGSEGEKFLGPLREAFEHHIAEFDPFDLHSFMAWIDEWGISRTLVLGLMFFSLMSILAIEVSSSIWNSIAWMAIWLFGTAPIWLPIALIIGAFRVWVWYAQSLYIAGRNPILLEVKMPREIMKSPRAMEIALGNFWLSSGEVTYLHRFWRGQVRPWFSLEIASFGGEIHFYIWTWKSYKNVAETAIYGQYPDVEIYEVQDYASKFVYDPAKYTLFATDFRYDPRSDAYPIKTYIDFELDKDPKEELKVEPLAQVLEVLGSIRKTEQAWIQITFRQAGKQGILSTTSSDKDWKKRVAAEVQKIRAQATKSPVEGAKDSPFPHATWLQTQQIQTLERHLGKLPFEVVMRGAYIADTTKGPFDGATYTAVRWIWRPFNNPGYLNGLRPARWHNPFDYPWQDFHKMRWNLVSRRFLDAYRRRSTFYIPWNTPVNIMTTETIASIWHPPSRTVVTPGLERIPSTKSEPPPNLPT